MTTPSEKPPISPEESQRAHTLLETAGRAAAIPHFYFNGFILGQGTGDVTLILQLNNQPVAALNCSFSVAKTLSNNLGSGISQLEKLAERTILTTEEIAKLMLKTTNAKIK